MYKPLNKTELAVCKAMARARAFALPADEQVLNSYDAHLLVQLHRANPGFDQDMFDAKRRAFEADARAEHPAHVPT